jgi:hypothetical protein
MKNVSSLFSRLGTSGSSSTTHLRGEKSEKYERGEKGAAATGAAAPKQRPEKEKAAAPRNVQADSKKAAKGEAQGEAATGGARTVPSKKPAESLATMMMSTSQMITKGPRLRDVESIKSVTKSINSAAKQAAASSPATAPTASSSAGVRTPAQPPRSPTPWDGLWSDQKPTLDQSILRHIYADCSDAIDARMSRHSLTMKEVMYLGRRRFKPEDVKLGLQTLIERGAILIDPACPDYVFLPAPAAVLAQDQLMHSGASSSPSSSPGSHSSSNTSSSSSSQTSPTTSAEYPPDSGAAAPMPEFFARMGDAERHFYERDSVAVLLHHVMVQRRYTSIKSKVEGDLRHFSIPRAVVEQAERNEDPGIGIHPYVIPRVIQVLENESICQPRMANNQDLLFSVTDPQLYTVIHKYSHQY